MYISNGGPMSRSMASKTANLPNVTGRNKINFWCPWFPRPVPMASGGFLGWLGELFGVFFGRRLGLWTGCGKVNENNYKCKGFLIPKYTVIDYQKHEKC